MSSKNDPKAFYAKLKIQLEDTTEFPALYMYKFIVPSTKEKIKQVHQIFDNIGAVIDTKKSSKGTYTSITITVNMKSADAIIEKYHDASAVEGIISL
jgi:putative lipoic acid-binding regulatory protein